MSRRVLAACLTLALLAGCSAAPASTPAAADAQPTAAPTAAPAASGVLTIGRSAAGYNPYLSDNTLVEQDAGLLFERFVQITPDLDLDYRLADAIDSAGNQVVIHLRGGCYFADGDAITPDDAAASLWAAKASPMYSARLANLENITVDGSSLTLTLSQPDSLFGYLCDLPVLKAEEVASTQPTASGRYTYGADGTLVKNSRAPFPSNGPDVIHTTEVNSYDEMVSGLSVGSLNLYAASDSASGSTGYYGQESYYKTNNLIFLGVNSGGDSPLVTTGAGRAMVSQLVDRRQLAESSYLGRAYPAVGAINSFYPCVNSQQVLLANQNTDGVAEFFAQLGYTMDVQSGYWADGTGKRASLRLLVYTGSTYKKYAASLIQQQLASQGIEVQILETDDFDAYRQQITDGQFDLYIGEIKLYNNMDLSPFFSGGAASAHLAQSETLSAAYGAFRANKSAAGDFEAVFAAEMPYIPLLWRSSTVVAARGISGLTSSLSDVFYSLDGLRFGNS